MDVAGHVATATGQPMFPQDAPTPFRVADMPDECVELLRAHMAQRMLPHRAADPVTSNLDKVRVLFIGKGLEVRGVVLQRWFLLVSFFQSRNTQERPAA
jgi:hypothetical protein